MQTWLDIKTLQNYFQLLRILLINFIVKLSETCSIEIVFTFVEISMTADNNKHGKHVDVERNLVN